MLYNCRIFWYYLFFSQCSQVLCQVCVETQLNYRDVPETYLYTYLEAYEKSNCLFWCTGTRVATAIGTRNVRKLFPEQVNVCCEGYVEDNNFDGNSIHCKPVCSPSCINGYCKSPGVCACDPGYLPDIFDTHSCTPLCINGCQHGTCTAPNTCQCDSGYNQTNGVCEPICSEPCENGNCIAPETCQCLPGYRKSDDDICEPYCSDYTDTGECIFTITCEPGWAKVTKGQWDVCEPMCTEPCVNGSCVAPDTCECLFGYRMTENYNCEPICSECLHGSCIAPGICVCNPGWYRKESTGICIAHCDYNCGNGTCVSPNVCECFNGYKQTSFEPQEEKDTTLCVPICNGCEGSCVAPEKCVCEAFETLEHVRFDGGPCDCFDNCSDEANKCERTICSLTTTTTIEGSIKETVEVSTITNYISTTEKADEYGNYIDSNELIIEKASWMDSKYLYGIGSAIILAILILMATAIMKRKKSKSFKGIIFHKDSK